MVNTRQGFLVRLRFLLKPPQNLVLLKCMAEVEVHQRQVKALIALVFVFVDSLIFLQNSMFTNHIIGKKKSVQNVLWVRCLEYYAF